MIYPIRAPLHPRDLALEARWLGRVSYDRAHATQLQAHAAVLSAEGLALLLLLEHEPTITLGRRGTLDDVFASEAILTQQGIALRRAERGGLATYHGPGQLVAYLIAPVRRLAPDIPTFVDRLEEVMLRTAAASGVAARRDPRNHGIWVGDTKLGSVGIAVSHGVSYHGIALNVDVDLTAFNVLRPCGLDVGMTSLAAHCEQAPTLLATAHYMWSETLAVFGLEPRGPIRLEVG